MPNRIGHNVCMLCVRLQCRQLLWIDGYIFEMLQIKTQFQSSKENTNKMWNVHRNAFLCYSNWVIVAFPNFHVFFYFNNYK